MPVRMNFHSKIFYFILDRHLYFIILEALKAFFGKLIKVSLLDFLKENACTDC